MTDTEAKTLTLLNNIAKEQKLQNHNIALALINSGGANFTSTLYEATITSDNNDDLHLFIKVSVLGEKFRNNLRLFEIENFAYTKLQENFRRLEDKHDVAEKDRLHMPKYYGANTDPLEEMIVLENLVSRGFSSYDRIKSVDWQYAASAVRELAKLHALSMALEEEDPEKYKKLQSYVRFDNVEILGLEALFKSSKINAMIAVREENSEKLKKFLDNMDLLWFRDHNKALGREVFLHKDFRLSNLMHRIRDDGSVELIPVDYQMLCGGSLVVDLLYFIFTGTDKQFRAQYYDKLIDHYYTELSAALTRLGLNPNKTYSREDCDSELKKKLPLGLGIAVLMLPVVTVEAEDAPTADETMDASILCIEKTGSLFPERLNGVVDDYVRWGVI